MYNIFKSLHILPLLVRNILLCLIIWLSACGGKPQSVHVNGQIEGFFNGLILLREASDNRIETIDSTRTDSQGNFSLEWLINNPSFFLLQLESEVEPIILLVEPGESVTIKGKFKGIAHNYNVSGSRGSLLVRNLNFRLYQTVRAIDSLSAYFRNSREHPRFDSIKAEIDSAYFRTINDHRNFTINFIKENLYSLSSILALHQQYDKERHILNKREDFKLFQMVDSVLFPIYPDNPLVYNLHVNVNRIKQQFDLFDRRQDMLSVGDAIPIFVLPLINGDTINLMEPRFKYTLIDFWATWCNDCATNSKKLLQVYSAFVHKGFRVIQVSLDDNPHELELAIKRDSLSWAQVTDYKQWESPIVDSFHINSIPSNYLIDNKGVIVNLNLTPKELKELLEKLLP